jgi:hypothetical protein
VGDKRFAPFICRITRLQANGSLLAWTVVMQFMVSMETFSDRLSDCQVVLCREEVFWGEEKKPLTPV